MNRISTKNLKQIFALVFLLCTSFANAQSVYKTPTGKKYHLASCRMVENVSKKLVDTADITAHGLTPCKICHPPQIEVLVTSLSPENKAVGESTSHQCMGMTKKGNRCKHRTRIANGYCYQHTR